MNTIWNQLKLNTRINVKYYLRNRLLMAIIIIVLFFFTMGTFPALFFPTQVERLQILIMVFSQVNSLFKFVLGLIALFTVYQHISSKCLKVVFTKPCLPDVWLLSHFIAPLLISAGMYAFAMISCLILAIAWSLSIKSVIAVLILTEFFKSLIIISCCTFLGILIHPFLAALVLISMEILAGMKMIVVEAMKSVKNVIALWILKAVKFIFDIFHYIIPTFSPYGNETNKALYSMKIASGNYHYFLLVMGYSIIVLTFFYFASLYLLKNKKYLYV